mgnify:CR=1 FL=1
MYCENLVKLSQLQVRRAATTVLIEYDVQTQVPPMRGSIMLTRMLGRTQKLSWDIGDSLNNKPSGLTIRGQTLL